MSVMQFALVRIIQKTTPLMGLIGQIDKICLVLFLYSLEMTFSNILKKGATEWIGVQLDYLSKLGGLNSF